MSDPIAIVLGNERDGLRKQNGANTRGAFRRYRDLVIGASLFTLLVIGYAAYRAGSVGRAIPYLKGQRVFVEPKINLGALRGGDQLDTKINVLNCGSSSLTVVGARKSCGCIATEAFPVQVPAGCNYPLELTISVPDKATEFAHLVELYISVEEGQSFQPYSVALSGVAIEK